MLNHTFLFLTFILFYQDLRLSFFIIAINNYLNKIKNMTFSNYIMVKYQYCRSLYLSLIAKFTQSKQNQQTTKKTKQQIIKHFIIIKIVNNLIFYV